MKKNESDQNQMYQKVLISSINLIDQEPVIEKVKGTYPFTTL